MKTLQLKTLPLLLVELPDSARDIKVFHDIGRPYISYFVGVETFRHYTDEDVELIGKLSELPEEWFEKYVDHYAVKDTSEGEVWAFRDYVTGKDTYDYQDMYPYDEAWESFYSLLEAKEQVYLNWNPYGEKPVYVITKYGVSTESPERFRKDHDRWQEAEFRTFDPERTYIFTVKTEEK